MPTGGGSQPGRGLGKNSWPRIGDRTRDLASASLAAVRSRLASLPHAARYLAVLDGAEERDERALGRIFGEELPSGLVLAGNQPVAN